MYTIHRQECSSLLSEETFRISRRTKVNSTYCTLKALPPVSQHYTFTAKPLSSGWDECFTCFKEDLLCFLVFPFHMQMYVETVTVLDARIKHSQSFHITRSVHVEVIPVSPKLRLSSALNPCFCLCVSERRSQLFFFLLTGSCALRPFRSSSGAQISPEHSVWCMICYLFADRRPARRRDTDATDCTQDAEHCSSPRPGSILQCA